MWLRPGVRWKVMIGVLVPLAIVLSAFAYIQYKAHERMVYGMSARTAGELGALVESGLAGAMMSDDRVAIQSTVDHLAANMEVDNLLLLDTNGVVRVAPGGATGQVLTTASPGCKECHAGTGKTLSTVRLSEPDEAGTLRNCRPILNRTECHGCHDPSIALNGVLITDLPLAPVEAHLDDYRRLTWLSLLGAMVLGGAALATTMNQAVVSPLTRLTAAVRSLAAGDLSASPGITSDDELGELAQALDQTTHVMQDRARLDDELKQRSVDLEQANVALHEKEAARAQLIKQIITAQEAERKRIARHLHDELAQSLTGLVMSLDATEIVLDEHAPESSARLRRTRDVAAQALDQTRQLILDLRPSMLDDLGLVSAIRWYADEYLGPTGVVVLFTTEGQPQRLPSAVETALFRIAQEAMSNVMRHAHADRVTIDLAWRPDEVELTVADDGCGFDMPSVARDYESGAGMGLLGMRERAEMLGGVLEIVSRIGEGTRVAFSLRLDGDEDDA